MVRPAETPLQQAGRHVREAQTRIAEQEGAVRRLERAGPGQELADAREALVQLAEFRTLANERLRQELARARPSSPHAASRTLPLP